MLSLIKKFFTTLYPFSLGIFPKISLKFVESEAHELMRMNTDRNINLKLL